MSKSNKPTTAATTAVDKVVDFLNANPGWHTVKDIDAGLNGDVARRTIAKSLKAVWDTGKDVVRRDVGAGVGSSAAAPTRWAGSTTTTPPPGRANTEAAPGSTTPKESAAPQPGASNTSDGDTNDAVVSTNDDQPEPPSDMDGGPESATQEAAASTESEIVADTGDDATPAGADRDNATGPLPGEEASPSEAAPIPTAPSPYVIAVAGILGDHADDGITASDLASASGVGLGLVWRILVSADITGAAISDKPYVLDPVAKWRPGEGDLASVNPAAAPSHVDCPCCGQSKRIPAGGASTGRTGGGGGARGGVCADGAPPLPPGTIPRLIREWAQANPGVQKTIGEITTAVGGRSSGAVGNALTSLSRMENPVVSEVSGTTPRTFRTAATSDTARDI